MSQKTNIEWTDVSWNPVTGCDKVSAGCKHCYAEVMAKRLQAMNVANMAAGKKSNGYENGFKVTLRPDRLNEPFKIKDPSRIFVCSMADLFHEDVPIDYIDKVFDVIRDNPQHVFQILTKRAQRMWEYFDLKIAGLDFIGERYAPDNLWLGVTVENQETANERIPRLLQIECKVRYLSCEPLLGEIDLWEAGWHLSGENHDINWVIVGGESGPNARPMHPDWVRNIQRQCEEQNVAFFFKQWGEWLPNCQIFNKKEIGHVKNMDLFSISSGNFSTSYRIGKKRAGNLLDGKVYNSMPEVI